MYIICFQLNVVVHLENSAFCIQSYGVLRSCLLRKNMYLCREFQPFQTFKYLEMFFFLFSFSFVQCRLTCVLDNQSKFQMLALFSGHHIGVLVYGGTPTWRHHTFARNISTNISTLDQLGELSSLLIFYSITSP